MSDDNNTTGNDPGDPFRGAGTHIRHLITELIPILLASALKILDADEGRKRLVELITAAFMAKYGAAMKRLELLIADVSTALNTALAERAIIATRLAETPQWLPASKANHGRSADAQIETPFGDWQWRHRIEAVILAMLLVVATLAALLTAKANLEGTGLPIFQSGALVWTMSALAPLSAWAVKSMWSHLHHEGLRRAFTYGLNILAVICILLWVLLYAASFHGLDAGPVTAGLLDDQSWWERMRATAFTVVTLLTEITVSSVLAHRLDKLAAFYSPNYWVENPEYIDLLRRLAALDARIAQLQDTLGNSEGELAGYTASLEAQINLAVLAYDARRGERHDPIL
ncbi:hypothetical protein [uncultured Tateyamaria sp.]|uniref:hypothetical protein n=1 Tax=uncultured Tateyamaria sp. TaxID=455651 RepID=UPI0026262DEC|nr:hypothetical protein [uncultured Tateyamaria sp.]